MKAKRGRRDGSGVRSDGYKEKSGAGAKGG